MKTVGVMQICDTLEAGGLEGVAVNLANNLPAERYESHLCTTRRDGPLANLISPDVRRLRLERKGRFDLWALHRLLAYIRANKIEILHVHGTSVFIGAVVASLEPRLRVIWHVHSGSYAVEQRHDLPNRIAARHVHGVIAVNQPLVEWARALMRVPSDRVWYLPNFVCERQRNGATIELPGADGARIVCVANVRPEKDHLNLLRAMRTVAQADPRATLLLIGHASNQRLFTQLQDEMAQPDLRGRVFWLGPRQDVPAVLERCDIGVLSSESEGLPMSLLEYGMAGLATATTCVGQCEEVLDHGRAGLLVPPKQPERLAEALLTLLRSSQRRAEFGSRFQQRIRGLYDARLVIEQLGQIYDVVLGTAPSSDQVIARAA